MYLAYIICLTVGLLFTLISAVADHLFGGHGDMDIGAGGHAEAGFDHGGSPGISFFSPTVLATFITAFGAFGMALCNIEATRSVWINAPLSAILSTGVALGVFWLFNLVFRKTQSSSESRVASLAGQAASVVSPIPENGVGEIAYVQGGVRYTSPARVENGAAVAAGRPVKIVRIVGTQFFVEPTS